MLSLMMLVMFLILSCFEPVQAGSFNPSVFSDDYQEARDKFISASFESGGSIKSILSPVEGPDGNSLFMDVASWKLSNAETVVVIGSATHGVEGFAGSAVQTGLLKDGLASRLPSNVGMVMIHAINPYGFAYLRRYDERNIDVNRNFLDYTQPLPRNAGYEELAEVLSPPVLSIGETVRTYWNFIGYVFSNGRSGLAYAISSGQYTYPKGLFYGGQGPSWSNVAFRQIVKELISRAKRVVFIDVHTGLGKYGKAVVILNEKPGSEAFQRARQWWGERVESSVGQSVSANVRGTLKLALPLMLPKVEVTAISMEFGTFSRRSVLMSLRDENWLFHHPDEGSAKALEIRQNLKQQFYPNTFEWNSAVWIEASQLIEQLLTELQEQR